MSLEGLLRLSSSASLLGAATCLAGSSAILLRYPGWEKIAMTGACIGLAGSVGSLIISNYSANKRNDEGLETMNASMECSQWKSIEKCSMKGAQTSLVVLGTHAIASYVFSGPQPFFLSTSVGFIGIGSSVILAGTSLPNFF